MKSCEILLVAKSDILKKVSKILYPGNYRILTATNGYEGIQILNKHKVELIICDCELPYMSAIEFLGRAKQRYPLSVRIALINRENLKTATKALEQRKIYRFLLKPWHEEELRITVRQGLAYYRLWRENKALVEAVCYQNRLLNKINHSDKNRTNILSFEQPPTKHRELEKEYVS